MTDQWQSVRRLAVETRHLVAATHLRGVDLARAAIEAKELELYECSPDDPMLRGAQGVCDGDVILVDSTLSSENLAWILAHELGHAVLHVSECTCDQNDVDLASPPLALHYGVGRADDYHPKKRTEQAANIFAAEFLLPSDWLHDRFMSGSSVSEIASAAGVTELAVLHVLANSVSGLANDSTGATQPTVLAPLDSSQLAAATVAAGPLLVSAGPGTGKTRTLIARIQHLLDSGAAPEQILALTFSNRAAAEMRSRILAAEAEVGSAVTVTTFHGFCLELLRRHHEKAGLPSTFTIIDDVDAVALLERKIEALPLNDDRLFDHPSQTLRNIVDAISVAKDDLVSPDRYSELVNQAEQEYISARPEDVERWREVGRVYPVYEQLLRELGVTDYGGLITHCVDLLQQDGALAQELRGEFRFVLVDEYQDMNRASSKLLQLLSGDGKGLWVVGDLRQSIYRFRGASPENILNFSTDFPSARTMALEVNYRSDAAIVDVVGAASALIEDGDGSQSWRAHRGRAQTTRITVAVARDPLSEAHGVASVIEDRLAAGLRPRDHAVLVRSHAQAQLISDVLNQREIPTCYLGDLFARPEIRSTLSLLMLATDGSAAGLMGVCELEEFHMPRQDRLQLIEFSRSSQMSILEALAMAPSASLSNSSSAQACRRILETISDIGYTVSPWMFFARFLFGPNSLARRLHREGTATAMQQLLALGQLLAIAKAFADRPMVQGIDPKQIVPEFLSFVRRIVANGSRIAATPDSALSLDAIQVITAHSAKGLEHPYVFVTNLVAGGFPARGQKKGIPPVPGMSSHLQSGDEEALFFVAVSRAQDELFLTRSTSSMKGKPMQPSPFLQVLESLSGGTAVDHVEWEVFDVDSSRETSTSSPMSTPRLFNTRQTEQLDSCPRQFEYRSILKLTQKHDPLPYQTAKFGALATWRWAKDKAVENCGVSAREIVEKMAEYWGMEISDFPLRESKYGPASLTMAALMEALLEQENWQDLTEVSAIYTRTTASYDPLIDHLYRDRDGRIIATKFVFRGDDDDRKHPALSVARKSLQEHFEGAEVGVELVDLVTGARLTVPYLARWEPDRVGKIENALALAEAGNYPIKPGYACQWCPCWMICPA